MSALLILPAVLLTLLGTLSAYLTSPHQQWREKPWPAWPGRLLAGLCALAAFACWASYQQLETAFFSLLSLSMLSFIALPLLAASWRASRKGR